MPAHDSNHSRKRRLEQITVIGGGLLLATMVILSWVPQSCPVMTKLLIGCPTPRLAELSSDEKEIARIAHSPVSEGSVTATARAQEDRTHTRITFHYRDGNPLLVGTLSVQTETGTQPLGLFTHPVIASLSGWSVATERDPALTLYRKNESEIDIATFLQAIPPTTVVDEFVARSLSLAPGTYIPLDTTLPSEATAVLTSLPPIEKDGTWNIFEETFDLSTARVDMNGQLAVTLQLDPSPSAASPLLLGTVHLDYRKSF